MILMYVTNAAVSLSIGVMMVCSLVCVLLVKDWKAVAEWLWKRRKTCRDSFLATQRRTLSPPWRIAPHLLLFSLVALGYVSGLPRLCE